MATGNATLESLRREIDEIDEALHELLMRRTEISRRIGQVKGNGPLHIRTGREVMVLRRLLAKHRGTLAKPVLVRIWREVFADSLTQQGQFSIALWAADDRPSLHGLTRDHFGVVTPVKEFGSAVRVINAVGEGAASIGILHLPESDAMDPWWRHLARGGEDVPRIIARLPLAMTTPEGLGALVIGLSQPEDTGHDRSFLVVESGEEISRSAVRDRLVATGFTVRETATWSGAGIWLHFSELDGFIAPDDPRLAAISPEAQEWIEGTWVVGGYPIPFTAEELANSPDEVVVEG
jgi:chorismate mutase